MQKLQPKYSNYLFTRKETFYWIGYLLSGNHDSSSIDQIEQDILRGRVNWPVFFRFCDQYWILGSVYKVFRDHNLLDSIPGELSDHLKEVYQLNHEKNTRILAQIIDLIALLNANQIEPIFLKGSGNLLDGLYGDFGERFIGDIDILVSENEFLKVAHLLEQDGYRARTPFNYNSIDGIKHYPRLNKPFLLADVEVHQLLANPPYHKHFNFNLVNQEKRRPMLIPDGCFVLSDSHKVIHNFIHSQLNDRGYFRGNPTLRQMYDLELLSQRVDLYQDFKRFGHYPIQSKNYRYLIRMVFHHPDKSDIGNLFTRLYVFQFNIVLRYPKLLDAIIRIDQLLQPVRYYSRNLIRALTDKHYRQKHIRRLISKSFV